MFARCFVVVVLVVVALAKNQKRVPIMTRGEGNSCNFKRTKRARANWAKYALHPAAAAFSINDTRGERRYFSSNPSLSSSTLESNAGDD